MSGRPDTRHAAVQILLAVFSDGRSLTAACAEVLPALPDARERAFAQDLCYGVLRWWPRLEAIARQLVHRPLPPRDADVHCLILLGLYQMLHTRVPEHAAVAATVAVTATLRKAWARGMVNAVLRRFQRERDAILAAADADEAAALAHPAWLLRRIRTDWPEDWRRIATENNARAPMWLRVNRRRGPREDYLRELEAAGIAAAVVPRSGPDALLLEEPVDIARLPGFADGRVSVQDGAAQFAAPLLCVGLDTDSGAEAETGSNAGAVRRVLDLCAAPGGKSAHILELAADVELCAVDVDEDRLQRVRETLERLGLQAQLVCADAANPQAWWDARPYDRILLDAPCSASGVIRRHPDIKRLRRTEDIAALAAQQRALLDAAWTLLAPGGMLLYATCSIMHEENNAQIEDFLARHPDARARAIEAAWGRALSCGRQILPGEDGMDGFFYACVDKLRT
jgi:16S rRNA (cytosine967-C5)-methyltransferase